MRTLHLMLLGALLVLAPWSLAAQETAAPGEQASAVSSAPAAEEAADPAPPETRAPKVVYPEDRPDWVEAAPAKAKTEGGSLDRIAVASGPHYSLGEARRQLEEAVQRAAAEYVNHHLGASNAAAYISYSVTPVETYEERPQFSFGPMHQAHALLEFDDAFRGQIEQKWQEARTLSRLLKTGLGAAMVFVLLSVVLGYVKADTATRGYYTRRLRFGAATVILAVAAAVYFAARWIPWMI